jgi:hypothetical protein
VNRETSIGMLVKKSTEACVRRKPPWSTTLLPSTRCPEHHPFHEWLSVDRQMMRPGMASEGEAEPGTCRQKESRMWYHAHTGHLNQESHEDCSILDRVAGTLSTYWNEIRQTCPRAPVASKFIAAVKLLGGLPFPASGSPQLLLFGDKLSSGTPRIWCDLYHGGDEKFARQMPSCPRRRPLSNKKQTSEQRRQVTR